MSVFLIHFTKSRVDVYRKGRAPNDPIGTSEIYG